MAKPGKPLSLLKIAACAEGVASSMLIIFVPYYVRSGLHEPSLTKIALIMSVPALTTLAASNFWGALADTTARYRAITSFCLFGFAGCLLSIPLMEGAGSVIASVAVLSLLYGAVRPLLLTQATLFRERKKSKAISVIFRYESLGFFMSALLFGSLFDGSSGWSAWLIFPAPAGLCLLAGILILFKMPEPEASLEVEEKQRRFSDRLLSSLRKDLGEVYRSPELLRLSMVVLVATAANFCFFGFFSMFFTEVAGGSSSEMSFSVCLSTLVGMFFFPLAGRWVATRGGRIVMGCAIAAWIACYALFTVVRNPHGVILIFILPIYPFFLVSTNALVAEAARSERRGGGLGALAGVSAISMALGTVLGGLTGDYIGLAAIPIVSSLGSGLAFIAFFLLRGRQKPNSRNQNDERPHD